MIKTLSGYFVCAENAGGMGVDSPYQNVTPGTWETFTFERQADGYYAIKCYDGVHYLNAVNGGESPIDARASSIGTNQKFGLHQVSGNDYFIGVKNYAAYGPEFSSMPSLDYPPA